MFQLPAPPRSDPGADVVRAAQAPPDSRRAEVVGLAPMVIGLALILGSLGGIRPEAIDALGLISVLPVAYWFGVAGIWLGFAWTVRHESFSNTTALAHVVALVVALTVVPAVVHEYPRFPTAWMHVGFFDHIAATGSVDPAFDARFNWPGAFSYGAYLTELLGVDSARALLRWTPLVVNLLLIAPLWLIASGAHSSQRRRWVAIWFALSVNWVGQDYLAPQALGIIFYLTTVGVLLNLPLSAARPRWWDLVGRLDRRFPRLVRSGAVRERAPQQDSSTWVGAPGLYLVLLFLAVALVVSHQLTPFVLIGGLVVLALTGRLENLRLVLVVLIATVAWLVAGASTYLEGNLSQLLGQVGRIGDSVGGGVTERFAPGVQRQIVLYSRVVLTGAVVLAGLFGFLRTWWRGRADWSVFGLAAFPAALLAAGTYGGEVVLRIALFSLPFWVVLAVSGLVPAKIRRPAVWVGSMVLVGLVLTPTLTLARYGNEAFERIRVEDVALWADFVEDAPVDAMVVVPNFAGPWRHTDLVDVYYRVYADEVGGRPEVGPMNDLVDQRPRSYVLIGVAAREYEEIANGLEPGWADRLEEQLVASGYEVVSRRGDGVLLRRSDDGG